jgi:hypothetical protein
MRRFTRLKNAFSKKIENPEATISLHYMDYNFARIHQTLRVTPAISRVFTAPPGRGSRKSNCGVAAKEVKNTKTKSKPDEPSTAEPAS